MVDLSYKNRYWSLTYILGVFLYLVLNPDPITLDFAAVFNVYVNINTAKSIFVILYFGFSMNFGTVFKFLTTKFI